MGFSYLCLLLFIFIFIVCLLKKNNEVSPKKIKQVINISLITLLLRYLILIAAFVIEKQSIIYSLRFFAFLNFFSIPLLVVVLLFIFMRDEKMTFNVNYIFMILLSVVYVYFILFNKINININSDLGFILTFENGLVINLLYLIIVSSLFVYSLIFLDKPYNNSIGMKILFVSLLVYIVEFILFLGGIKVFPYPIISECLVLLVLFKGINTFK